VNRLPSYDGFQEDIRDALHSLMCYPGTEAEEAALTPEDAQEAARELVVDASKLAPADLVGLARVAKALAQDAESDEALAQAVKEAGTELLS